MLTSVSRSKASDSLCYKRDRDPPPRSDEVINVARIYEPPSRYVDLPTVPKSTSLLYVTVGHRLGISGPNFANDRNGYGAVPRAESNLPSHLLLIEVSIYSNERPLNELGHPFLPSNKRPHQPQVTRFINSSARVNFSISSSTCRMHWRWLAIII